MEQSYKEKYEDILARLERAKYDNEVCDERFCCVIDEIIPELAESKDERIRKEIIEVIESLSLEKEYEYIAWLEKQGQVKESFISQHENRTCEENGNSLTSEDERIRKEIINYFQCQSEEEPTRKEIHNKWIAWLEKQGEQKFTWSEEDEKIKKELIGILSKYKYFYSKEIAWLKSLRPQSRWKPSELQLGCLSDAIEHYNSLGYPASKLKELLDNLKKLKEE